MTLADYFLTKAPELGRQWDDRRNTAAREALGTGSRERVWWRCDRGHGWQASVNARVYQGRGCPYCAGQEVYTGENDLQTLSPDRAALWHPTKNGALTPGDLTPGSRKRVWWQCERGHDWCAPVYSVSAGSGCPWCAGKRVIPGQTDLATTHPDIAARWDLRNAKGPEQVSAGSHKKVWWRCEKGHVWEALIASVAKDGCGCPYCAGKRAIPGETDLETLFPQLAKQWHPTKNGKLNPRQVLPSAHDRVWWVCELGHEYPAVVFSRTRQKPSGCPYCTGRKVLAGFNDLATRKPKLAGEWYQPLNGRVTAADVTPGSNKKVWWRCADGHVWRAAVYSRTRKRGAGCPVCAGVVKQAGPGKFPAA